MCLEDLVRPGDGGPGEKEETVESLCGDQELSCNEDDDVIRDNYEVVTESECDRGRVSIDQDQRVFCSTVMNDMTDNTCRSSQPVGPIVNLTKQNEKYFNRKYKTCQETLTITGGAGLSSLDLQLSLFCFFNLTGTFGVSTLVSQGLRDLLTSDQAEDNKNNQLSQPRETIF